MEEQREHQAAEERAAEERRQKTLQEASQQREENSLAVGNRVREGVPRAIASGITLQDRMHLTHETARGKWMSVTSHAGLTFDRWVGCGCGQLQRDTWCTTYKGAVATEDKASFAGFQKERATYEAAVAKRVEEGMPAVVARGITKARRQHLSHTLNDCMGVNVCGKRKVRMSEPPPSSPGQRDRQRVFVVARLSVPSVAFVASAAVLRGDQSRGRGELESSAGPRH